MCAEVNNGRAHKAISIEILVAVRRSYRWRARRRDVNDDRLAWPSAAELCAKITDVRTDVNELIHTPKDVCRRWRNAVRRKRGKKTIILILIIIKRARSKGTGPSSYQSTNRRHRRRRAFYNNFVVVDLPPAHLPRALCCREHACQPLIITQTFVTVQARTGCPTTTGIRWYTTHRPVYESMSPVTVSAILNGSPMINWTRR